MFSALRSSWTTIALQDELQDEPPESLVGPSQLAHIIAECSDDCADNQYADTASLIYSTSACDMSDASGTVSRACVAAKCGVHLSERSLAITGDRFTKKSS